jgi:predicted transcriptional regulator
METTIRLNPKTKGELDQFRQFRSESYDELVRKLIHLAKLTEKEPKLSQKTIQEIKEARERIKKGEYYTQEEVEKRFGL